MQLLTSNSLEATETVEEIEFYDAEYANDGQPFATFHFYYRSMGTYQL